MTTKSLLALAVSALLPASGLALGQIFFAPYDVTFSQELVGLVQKDQVRQELKLKEDESTKLEAALLAIKEKYQKEVKDLQKLPVGEAKEKYAKFRTVILEESVKAIQGTLSPEKFKRLKQIELQQLGPKAFDDPGVRKVLGLSEEQKNTIKEAADMARQEKDRAMRTTGLTYQAMQGIQQRQLERSIAALSKDQHKIWHELVGAPFTLRPGSR